ncbi:hypothetical protein HYW75_00365 [Candidatus Pacearchaeota archaeon]|nr:hypothetical protein [Candidatus Pacearchaeota archaeon]
MGSVKDLVVDNSVYGRLYVPPSMTDFGRGVWEVKGTFSVKDLKKEIPETNIKYKPEGLTMQTAAFFEYLADTEPWINTCYLGVVDNKGKITDLRSLLDKGETTNHIAMRLAHTPDSPNMSWTGNLKKYREVMQLGQLQCGVADVESIFRKGFPLGSSLFKKIFSAVGMDKEYETLATYDEVVKGLNNVRAKVKERGLSYYPSLEILLKNSHLGVIIPNPGFVLKDIIYDSTTKFEPGGDRVILKKEERILSGLSNNGYDLWVNFIFPKSAERQISFAKSRKLLNMDGKEEIVSFRGMPWITDFALTVDENRTMIIIEKDEIELAIPSNKEIQRALFTKAGVDIAINEAKKKARENEGNSDNWRFYFGNIAKDMKIDIRRVAEESCELMSYATAEVTNRILESRVFDIPPLESWVGGFLPFASKIKYQ